MPSVSTSSISSGVTSHGPVGLKVSADLPFDHWPLRSIWKARSLTSLTSTNPAIASRASSTESRYDVRRPITIPSSTSQSVFVEPRGIRTSSYGPDDRVGRLGEQDRLVRDGLPGLGGVVAVVEADAEDLVRPGDRRTDALIGEGVHLALRRTLLDQRAQRVQPAGAEEGLVEVGDGVGDVDVRGVVDADDGAFGADGAEAHQLHGVSCGVRCPDQGWVARPVQPGRARNRLPDSGNSCCSAGDELAPSGGDQQLVELGSDEGQARRVRGRQLDDVEQVTGGGVAAHLALAPRGQPEVAGRVDAQAVGHCVRELERQASWADGSAGPGRSRAPRPDGQGRCRRCRSGSRRERTPCRWRGRGRRRAPWSCRRRIRSRRWECRAPVSDTVPTRKRPRASHTPSFHRSSGWSVNRSGPDVREPSGATRVSRWCSATTRAPSAATAVAPT